MLYNAERKSFTKQRRGLSSTASQVKVPPLDFTTDVAAARPAGNLSETETGSDQADGPGPAKQHTNRIRASMRIVSESLGNDLELTLRYPPRSHTIRKKRQRCN